MSTYLIYNVLNSTPGIFYSPGHFISICKALFRNCVSRDYRIYGERRKGLASIFVMLQERTLASSTSTPPSASRKSTISSGKTIKIVFVNYFLYYYEFVLNFGLYLFSEHAPVMP